MFMAVSREIPRFLHDSLWDRGFPSILTSGTLKAGNGFVRTRQMTGLEKKSRVRECVAESPFCYRENCGKCAAAPAGSDPVPDGAGMEKLTGRNRTV